MTPAQRLQLRAAEIEARLAAIDGIPAGQRGEALKAERTALNREMQDIPDKLKKALEAEGADAAARGEQAYGDGAFAEMSAVTAQATVGDFLDNLYQKRPHEGAIAELQSHYGMGRNDLPVDMLRAHMAATPAPTDTGRTEQPVLQPVFALGDSNFLSVAMPVVEAGDSVFPVLTTRPAVGGPFKDSTSVAETDAVFEAEVLQPERIQASFRYRRTDASRFPQMDQSLRSALAMGLSEAMDKEVVDQIVTDVTRSVASAADTYDSYRERLIYDHIDGRFATMESDMRLLVGSATLQDMSPLFRGAQGDVSAVENVRRLSGGLRVSPHIAAAAGDKQDAIIRRGMRRDMVCPVWRNVTIIFDEVTAAATGEIIITGIEQFAKKVIRPAGFARVETQHA